MSVRFATTSDRPQWDEYVRSTQSRIEHLFDWGEVYRQAFECRIVRLISESAGRINGVLTIFIIPKSILGKGYASSLPGGICADDKASAEELLDFAIGLIKDAEIPYLKLRECVNQISDERLATRSEFTYVIETHHQQAADIWAKIKSRRNIRRAQSAGLVIRWDNGILPDFYRVYSINMRDLGTPAIPYAYFKEIHDRFPRQIALLTVSYRGKVIGGMFFDIWKDTIHYSLGSSLRHYFQYRPNDLMYWEAIVYACENGFRILDLGSSIEGSGNAIFKEKYLAKPTRLVYQYYLNTRKTIPDSRGGSMYPYFRMIWQRLPLTCADALSPLIRRYLPIG